MPLFDDLRYAFRMMRRSPGFTLAVVFTVALGIAANTAIFSVVNAELLRPLPFREPDRLVQVAEKNDKLHLPTFTASVLNFLSWREQQKSFEELGAIGFNTFTLTGSGEPEQLNGNRLSPATMRILGLVPVAGRAFSDAEERPEAAPVVMLSEGLWKRRFGSDPRVIGQRITLNGQSRTVIGIAPPSLNLISGGDIYEPQVIDPAKEIRLNHVILVFGRLKPGVTLQQAQAEMDAVSARVGRQFPEVKDWGIRLVTMFDTFVSTQLKDGLLVLMFAVVLVLLIACANIANLLLARAAARQREMAVRSALGAGRGRLINQLLVESVALALTGGLLGIAGAFAAVRAINALIPPTLLPVPGIKLDGSVLAFAAGLTLLTGLLFGVAPAWRTAKVDLNDVLKSAGRGSEGGVRSRLRNALAASEIALATLLLIAAGLLIQSFVHLQHAQLGFQSHGLITFQVAPPVTQYPVTSQAPQFYRNLLDSLQSLPGVVGAAVSSGIPFGAGSYNQSPFATSNSPILPADASVPVDWRLVSPGFFHTMNIPLLRGREFTYADAPPAQLAVIVSQATAKKFWGDADPMGRDIHRPSDNKLHWTVVGVAGDVRSSTLNQESPTLYFPVPWRASPLMDVAVRTQGPPEALLPAIRQKVHELDAQLALANVRTMDDWVSNTSAQPRLNAVLLGVFAAVAMLIAAIGIYGVLAYSVTQRTREIGVRLALGAQPGGVLRLVVSEGLKVTLVGIAIGLAAAIALGRAVASLVYGVPVRDPLTFAAVALALAVVSLAACAIPARRAARVDPMVALRYE
jgi:putative ABC transport system permease protein